MSTHTQQKENRPSLWSVFLNRFRSSNQKSKKKQPAPNLFELRVEPTDSGLSVLHHQHRCWEISWDSVCGIYAFKKDLITTDLICFAFQRSNISHAAWCIHEEMEGYRQLLPVLEQITEGRWPELFSEVAFPAFEANWTEIWKAPNASPLDDDASLIWTQMP